MANFFLVRIKINGKWHDRIEHDRTKAMNAVRACESVRDVEEARMFECLPTYLSYTRIQNKPFKLEGL